MIKLFLAGPLVLRPLLRCLGGVIRVSFVADALFLLFPLLFFCRFFEIRCAFRGFLPSTFELGFILAFFCFILILFLIIVLSLYLGAENIFVLFQESFVFLLSLKGELVLSEESLKLISILANES